MSRRFQFSLGRLLVTTAIFSLAEACFRWAIALQEPHREFAVALLAIAFSSVGAGICLLLSRRCGPAVVFGSILGLIVFGLLFAP